MEQLVMRDGRAELHLRGASMRTVPSSAVIAAVRHHTVRGLHREPLPAAARWRVDCGPATLFVLELEPEVRRLEWITPDSPAPVGPEATYGKYRLALPFTIVVVPFQEGRVQPQCEVFYRNRPLAEEGLDARLLWSNLLNVSPFSFGCTAWMCSVHLGHDLKRLQQRRRSKTLSMSDQLEAVVTHLFGPFNRSSEVNEGKSCFSKALEDGLDRRVTDVVRWQKATREDPAFVLAIDWKPTDHTVRTLVEGRLASIGLPRDVSRTDELIDALIARTDLEGSEP